MPLTAERVLAGAAYRTARLDARAFRRDDAPFVLELLNDPGWLEHIGDRGVRSLDDARAYICEGPLAMYRRDGFGLYVLERRGDGALVGTCGLIDREGLDGVDLGFALLPAFRGEGYALEAARGALELALSQHGLSRVAAIVSPGNRPSQRLLAKLGFVFERTLAPGPGGDTVRLLARHAV